MTAAPVPVPASVPEPPALHHPGVEDEVPPPPPAPRLLMPLIAAGMISLSLERLGVLHWIPALGLFALQALFVFGAYAARRRALDRESKYDQSQR